MKRPVLVTVSVDTADDHQARCQPAALGYEEVVRNAGPEVDDLVTELLDQQLQENEIPGVRVGGQAADHYELPALRNRNRP